MGENVHALAGFLLIGDGPYDLETMHADLPAHLDILVCNLARPRIRETFSLSGGGGKQRAPHFLERPAKIDGCWPLLGEVRNRMIERGVGRIGTHRKCHAVGRRRPDQRRTSDLHGENGLRHVFHGRHGDDFESMRQLRLIDDLDAVAGIFEPDGAVCLPSIFMVDRYGLEWRVNKTASLDEDVPPGSKAPIRWVFLTAIGFKNVFRRPEHLD